LHGGQVIWHQQHGFIMNRSDYNNWAGSSRNALSRRVRAIIITSAHDPCTATRQHVHEHLFIAEQAAGLTQYGERLPKPLTRCCRGRLGA
jgi:hypothetical protein